MFKQMCRIINTHHRFSAFFLFAFCLNHFQFPAIGYYVSIQSKNIQHTHMYSGCNSLANELFYAFIFQHSTFSPVHWIKLWLFEICVSLVAPPVWLVLGFVPVVFRFLAALFIKHYFIILNGVINSMHGLVHDSCLIVHSHRVSLLL